MLLGVGQIRVHVNLHGHEFDLFNSFSVTDDYISLNLIINSQILMK